MLQVVFVAIFIGVGLIQVPKEKADAVLAVFDGFNHVIIRMVDVIMLMAPLGVFSLISNTITTVAQDNISQVVELLGALGFYCIAVISGLFILWSLLLNPVQDNAG